MRTRSLVRSAPWSQPSGRRSLQGGPYPARGRGLTPRRQASVLILAWRDRFLDRCNLSITISGRNVRQGEVFLPRPPPLSPSGQVDISDVAFTSRERLPGRERPGKPIPDFAPDLAVEILSKGNTKAEIKRKLGACPRIRVRNPQVLVIKQLASFEPN